MRLGYKGHYPVYGPVPDPPKPKIWPWVVGGLLVLGLLGGSGKTTQQTAVPEVQHVSQSR